MAVTSMASVSPRSGKRPGSRSASMVFPGPRRTGQQEVVGAGGGHFEGPARCSLAGDIAHVRRQRGAGARARAVGVLRLRLEVEGPGPAGAPQSKASRASVGVAPDVAPGTSSASATLARATTTSG